MNRIYTFFFFICLCVNTKLSAQIVNIPDANFKAALLAHNPIINTNGDGEIQLSEAQGFTGTLYVSYWNISDLTGIESFTSITGLNCNNNNLTSLNLIANTALREIYCTNNILTSVDFTGNIALEVLDCSYNVLSSLGLTHNKALRELNCMNNTLTSLDFTENIALEELICAINIIASLNLTANAALTYLDCENNQLTSLNLTGNKALQKLVCWVNNLTSLDLTANTALVVLNFGINQLTSLDLTGNIALEELNCEGNQLTSLDIRNGNNNIISSNKMTLFGNPDLICVSVDDPIWSAANWPNKDPQTQFSSNCNLSHSEDLDEDQKENIKLYPNPTNGTFHLDLGQIYTDAKFKITDMQGREITQLQLSNQQQLEMELQEASGVYLVHIYSGEGLVSTLRLVKE